eukprot:95254_1
MLPLWYKPLFLDGRWTKIESYSSKWSYSSMWLNHIHPILSNNNKFIIVPPVAPTDSNVWRQVSDHKGIYQYDITHDNYTQTLELASLITSKLFYHTVTFDPIQQMLWIFDPCGTIYKINMQTHNFYFFSHSLDTYDSKSIVINNNLHIIGGTNNNQHLVYSTKYKQFIPIYTFKDYPAGFRGQITHIKSQNILLLFIETSETIYRYNIETYKWSTLPTKMPIKRAEYVVTSVLNEQFVLIFGGTKCIKNQSSWRWPVCHDIWIFSLRDESFSISLVKCPKQDINYKVFSTAIALKHEYHDELIISGYVQIEWTRLNIHQH